MNKRKRFEELFLTYYSPLVEYAYQYVNEDDAQELVQDLMMHMWEEYERLIITTSLKSYLFVSVKNRCLNAIRNQKYRQRVRAKLYDYLSENQLDDPDFYMVNELGEKIDRAIRELPPNYRTTFEMSRLEGMSNAQIAEALEISIKTVEYRISQSLKILRIKLKDYLPVLSFLFLR
ncbi:RNA polymerase sigma-70 factor [Sphingobacterium alkalisoli]|uniref:RNA polymerase sigma-70 factor n=1 Tax=Sphingobacterium alkalisoli TaxID=1874115 RepID=A0A4U0H5T3_9SPHI|nr:RNA polymerase sigma-70 factor [Sphingobacterium alkalisoli]TJY66574.1 RNA polymerase sigma-70 factor [Sphingobacterium alkalisoli]GGH15561.1 DNA-directed RNA polymerase sigma-70 factor [Sphingobacterium alkalisoli]